MVDDLSIQGLQALAASDPRSLDIALLDPLRQQLQAAGDNAPPELSAAVDAPAGPSVVLTAGAIYFLSMVVGPAGGLVRGFAPGRHLEA